MSSLETREVSLDQIDLLDDAGYRRGFPHHVFRTLRREAPVFLHPVPEGWEPTRGRAFWVLSKYQDIQSANRDSDLFTSREGPSFHRIPETISVLPSMDGPEHARLRRLVSAGFTPRMVGRLEERARRWAVSIVQEALSRETCDFVADVAYQLPMHLIADILGVPLDDRKWLFSRVNDLLQCTDPKHPIPAEQQPAIQLELFQYGRALAQEKRRNPQDDVWTQLCTVEIETETGERTRLSEIELDVFFVILIIAGSETTQNAIALGLLALLDNPDQLSILREQPQSMKGAVEEILRWSSPAAYVARTATRNTEIRGVPIAAGDRVTFWYPSANRDEEIFEEPFRFDIARPLKPHLSFGAGSHFCLGAAVARFEIGILFEELFARAGEIEILKEPTYSVQGIINPILVTPKEMPVRIRPR